MKFYRNRTKELVDQDTFRYVGQNIREVTAKCVCGGGGGSSISLLLWDGVLSLLPSGGRGLTSLYNQRISLRVTKMLGHTQKRVINDC